MRITVLCKEIEIDADNDPKKIMGDEAYEQEIYNHTFQRVTVTDDNDKVVFESDDINDFTVEDNGEDFNCTTYDYVRIQQCDDYCYLDIDGEFNPKSLVFYKYKIAMPEGEEEGIAFEYTESDDEFDHGESGFDYDVCYKREDGEFVDFDPEEEDEE